MSLEVLSSLTAYENPVVTETGLVIYFGAPLDGEIRKDIWIASRASRDDPFASPHPVASVNSAGIDTLAWISGDGCRLYFLSDRDGGLALWMASRRAL
jgi:hypothetical protein